MHELPNPHSEGCPWHDAAALFGPPNVKWCEQTLCAWVSEPANAWSNIAYAVVAWLVIRDARAAFERAFGVVIGAMGALSLLYHASNNLASQWLDFFGMFAMFGVVTASAVARIGWRERRAQARVGVYAVAASMGSMALAHLARVPYQALVGLWATAALAFETWWAVRRARATPWLGGSMLLIVLAGLASLVDHRRVLCVPDQHLLHGHAAWHVLSAMSLGALARHWRTTAT